MILSKEGINEAWSGPNVKIKDFWVLLEMIIDSKIRISHYPKGSTTKNIGKWCSKLTQVIYGQHRFYIKQRFKGKPSLQAYL